MLWDQREVCHKCGKLIEGFYLAHNNHRTPCSFIYQWKQHTGTKLPFVSIWLFSGILGEVTLSFRPGWRWSVQGRVQGGGVALWSRNYTWHNLCNSEVRLPRLQDPGPGAEWEGNRLLCPVKLECCLVLENSLHKSAQHNCGHSLLRMLLFLNTEECQAAYRKR